MIWFGKYNIRNGWNGGLESALLGMDQANIDLGVLQEANLTDRVYAREFAGYKVVVSDVPSWHHGGMEIL